MSLSVTLSAATDHRLVLSHYEPGETTRAHRHDEAQVSLLIAGGYVEDSVDGVVKVSGPSLSCKPGGFEHQSGFGPAGALILSVRAGPQAQSPDRYRVVSCASHQVGRTLLSQATAGDAAARAMGPSDRDLVRGRNAQPAWLDEAQQRLIAEPLAPIATLARAMGRHPVHFARVFGKALGRAPAQFRRDWRIAQAVGQIVRSDLGLAQIAQAEGFADQAHMTRAVGLACGWSPGALRRLFAI